MAGCPRRWHQVWKLSLNPVVVMGLCKVPVHKLSHLCFSPELSKLFQNQSSCSELMLTTGFTFMYCCQLGSLKSGVSLSRSVLGLWERATHFALTSRTGIILGPYSLPLSFPSAQRWGSTELWTAPRISVGWVYRLLCLKWKHLAVPLHEDWLSPAQAGLSLHVLLGSSSGVMEMFSFSFKLPRLTEPFTADDII